MMIGAANKKKEEGVLRAVWVPPADDQKTRLQWLHFKKLDALEHDYQLRCCQIASCVVYAVLWASFAAVQACNSSNPEILKLLGSSAAMLDFIACGVCVASLSLCIYMYVHAQQKKKIDREVASLEKITSQTGESCEKSSIDGDDKSNDKERLFNVEDIPSKREKILSHLFVAADTVDISATAVSTVMQILAFLGGVGVIFNLNTLPDGTAMNTQGIVDTTTNILGFGVVMLLVCCHATRVLNKDRGDPSREVDKSNLRNFSVLATGAFLIMLGKILMSFESRGALSYTGEMGCLGADRLPIGLAIRVLGAAFYIVAVYMMMSNKKKEIGEEQHRQNNHWADVISTCRPDEGSVAGAHTIG